LIATAAASTAWENMAGDLSERFFIMETACSGVIFAKT
jgi:hypothetical protein